MTITQQQIAALVKRLRVADEYAPLGHDGWEAADMLEKIAAERDALDKACITWSEVSQRNYQRAKAAEAQVENPVSPVQWRACLEVTTHPKKGH